MFNFLKKKKLPLSLSNQEIFLLERYSSIEYYEALVNSWEEMISFVDSLLKKFMLNLPDDYRKRAQPYQPDIVWGDRVIPNFQFTLEDLKDGLVAAKAGNILGLRRSSNVMSDLKGVSDFSTTWMNEVQLDGEDIYYDLLNKAFDYARNISLAIDWNSCVIYGALRNDLKDPVLSYHQSISDWPLPNSLPKYSLNYAVQIKTGEPILKTGIYRSIEPLSTCRLLIQEINKYEDIDGDWVTAPQVYAFTKEIHYYPEKGDNNDDPYDYLKELDTTWILVEKVSGHLSDNFIEKLSQ